MASLMTLTSDVFLVSLDEHRGVRFLDGAVTALAGLEVDDRLEEMAAAKIGPEHFRDVDLRVRDLPQQKVRHAQLAAGADEKIGIMHVGGVQMIGEEVFVDD